LEPLDTGIPGKKAKDLNHGILGIHGKKTELKLGKGDKPLSGLPDAFAFQFGTLEMLLTRDLSRFIIPH
jgi:hypothetical protein